MREEFEGMDSCEIAEIIFNENYIRTKNQLLDALGRYVKKAKSQKGLPIFEERSNGFKKVYLNLLLEFYDEVQTTPLFETLEPKWYYSFRIDETGASLSLNHASSLGIDEEEHYIDYIYNDACFELVTKTAKMLSVEEYAENYGVSVGTVRQWIRRAKIRGAVKTASGWRISELCEVRERKYSPGSYYYQQGSVKTDTYPFLYNRSQVDIKQDTECSEVFHITLYGDDEDDYTELQMSRQEREKFELFLISHPDVTTGRRVFVESDSNCEVY